MQIGGRVTRGVTRPLFSGSENLMPGCQIR
jgi:hypothetical protein